MVSLLNYHLKQAMPLLKWSKKTDELLNYEDQIFSCLKRKPKRYYVFLDGDKNKNLWTFKMDELIEKNSKLPIVMLHGLGAGMALWFKNLEELAKDRPIYSFDLPGFGQSFRAKNFKNTDEAEDHFIEAIEGWRKETKLNNFILLGHSFGGYLAAAYALKHPKHVKGIILVDAWGFARKKEENLHLPRRVRLALSIYRTLSPNPLSILRVAGSWGPSLITRYRPDIVRKFNHCSLNDGVIANYIYYCNAQEPTGEMAFKYMVDEQGFAQKPMVDRVGEISAHIPIAMVYGKDSWLDHSVCYEVQKIRHPNTVHVELINQAGHHVYVDHVDTFNDLVREYCEEFDERFLSQSHHTHNQTSAIKKNINNSKIDVNNNIKENQKISSLVPKECLDYTDEDKKNIKDTGSIENFSYSNESSKIPELKKLSNDMAVLHLIDKQIDRKHIIAGQ